MSVEYKTQIELQQKLEKAILILNKKYAFDGKMVWALAKDISETLFVEVERDEIFEPKEKEDYAPIVVDVLTGHVHEIEGDVVYAKYLINGEEHKAAFDIALFKEAGADFQGAQVSFLTIKTDNKSAPYDLRIELFEERTFNEITGDVQKKLDRLEQFDNFEEVRQ
jgi:hypothetical protein